MRGDLLWANIVIEEPVVVGLGENKRVNLGVEGMHVSLLHAVNSGFVVSLSVLQFVFRSQDAIK